MRKLSENWSAYSSLGSVPMSIRTFHKGEEIGPGYSPKLLKKV